jgi:hypothetical protein
MHQYDERQATALSSSQQYEKVKVLHAAKFSKICFLATFTRTPD